MTTTDVPMMKVAAPSTGGIGPAVGDTLLIAGRNLRKVLRVPQLIVFSTIQPVMVLLLFSFVFGGIAKVPGVSYREFIVPGVLVQTLTFAAMSSGVGLATDLQSGMIDRFRSLPIARSAVLIGRTLSDGTRITFQATLLLIVAYMIGFRFLAGPLRGVGVLLCAVVFGIGLSTMSAWIGLALKDPETVQVAGFVPIFPLIFASTAFSPIHNLPGWMQEFARINPVTAAIDTMRGLALGGVYAHHLGSSLWHMLAWSVAIIGGFTALAVRQYRSV
jgi:ABC-2 type transport system permease protein/oleandomycin transport system permease protein